jgi:hypothetical protein
VCAIDGNPERRMAKALRAAFPGRVVLVEYDPKWSRAAEVLKRTRRGVPLKARVNRTDAIDGMMDSVRQLRWRPLADAAAGVDGADEGAASKDGAEQEGRRMSAGT